MSRRSSWPRCTGVLRRAYKADQATTAAALRGLVDAKEIIVEQTDTVRRALRRSDAGADFADALIAELGADAGREATITFDRKAATRAGMQLLGNP